MVSAEGWALKKLEEDARKAAEAIRERMSENVDDSKEARAARAEVTLKEQDEKRYKEELVRRLAKEVARSSDGISFKVPGLLKNPVFPTVAEASSPLSAVFDQPELVTEVTVPPELIERAVIEAIRAGRSADPMQLRVVQSVLHALEASGWTLYAPDNKPPSKDEWNVQVVLGFDTADGPKGTTRMLYSQAVSKQMCEVARDAYVNAGHSASLMKRTVTTTETKWAEIRVGSIRVPKPF